MEMMGYRFSEHQPIYLNINHFFFPWVLNGLTTMQDCLIIWGKGFPSGVPWALEPPPRWFIGGSQICCLGHTMLMTPQAILGTCRNLLGHSQQFLETSMIVLSDAQGTMQCRS